jgi:hypothetical protein
VGRVETQFVGSAARVADQLEQLRDPAGADELIITTITRDHSDRVRSYELLAREWQRRDQETPGESPAFNRGKTKCSTLGCGGAAPRDRCAVADLAERAGRARRKPTRVRRVVWSGVRASMKIVTREQVPGYPFVLYDTEPNDVANTLAALLDQNVRRFPARRSTARRIPRPVAVHNTDTDTTATMAFEQDRTTVYNDLAGRPSIIVRADTSRLRDVWRLRMAAGGLLPIGLATNHGRYVIGQIVTRKIIIKGLLVHPVTALQFISLMSSAE